VTPRPAVFCAWLRSGAVLPAVGIGGVVAAGKPAMVAIETPSGGHLEVPMTMVAAVRTRANDPATLTADRAGPDDNHDYLYVVKDGKPQRFTVDVHSIHDGKVWFALRGVDYDFPLRGDDSAAAIVFGQNRGFAPDRLAEPRVTVVLTGGERCQGKLLALDATLSVLLDEGARLVVPSDRLLRLEVATAKLRWLSTLVPRVEQTPAFDRVWPWTVDGSPAGPGIHLGGKVYSRGLVLVPRTRLNYDLGGRYDLFEATIGIDERGGPQAHAIFRVFTDGKLKFESAPMVLGSPPLAVHVELDRCRELSIEADFGKNFDLGDLCAFADARVLQR
jgi:NPCBM/NEW2 domain